MTKHNPKDGSEDGDDEDKVEITAPRQTNTPIGISCDLRLDGIRQIP